MGLLDDAIREHLDLKRRRGADPTEVERAEREALGPVRRAPEPAAAELGADEGEFAYDQEDEVWDDTALEDAPAATGRPSHRPPADLEPDFGDDPAHDYGHEPEPPAEPRRSRLSRIFGRPEAEPDHEHEEEHLEPPPPIEPRGRTIRPLEDELEPDPFDDEPAPRPQAPPPHPAAGAVGDHTVEYNVEDEAHERENPGAEEDEDVLEETPEFLQDTPDHDRLWFEQRPPRDFDFDG